MLLNYEAAGIEVAVKTAIGGGEPQDAIICLLFLVIDKMKCKGKGTKNGVAILMHFT